MSLHKYKLGQLVQYIPDKLQEASPSGDYKITRLLPAQGADHQYRIKNGSEPFERIARESQLSFRNGM